MSGGQTRSEFRPLELRDRLAVVGLQVGAPASSLYVRANEQRIGCTLAKEWRDLYEAMDGALGLGTASFVSIWPLAEIVQQRLEAAEPDGLIAFADQLFYSTVFIADFEYLDNPVLDNSTRQEVAPTIYEFFKRLVADEL